MQVAAFTPVNKVVDDPPIYLFPSDTHPTMAVSSDNFWVHVNILTTQHYAQGCWKMICSHLLKCRYHKHLETHCSEWAGSINTVQNSCGWIQLCILSLSSPFSFFVLCHFVVLHFALYFCGCYLLPGSHLWRRKANIAMQFYTGYFTGLLQICTDLFAAIKLMIPWSWPLFCRVLLICKYIMLYGMLKLTCNLFSTTMVVMSLLQGLLVLWAS